MTHDAPPPNAVRGNDWPALPVADAAAFEPRLGVTVVLSYFEAPGALACALAALDRQDYPRGLLEAVVVDDGSREPLDDPRARIGLPATGVPLHVVRQENRGFGLARARNAGARAARHPILVFLDGDTVAEPGPGPCPRALAPRRRRRGDDRVPALGGGGYRRSAGAGGAAG